MSDEEEPVTQNPPDYTDGLGELIRAYRTYMGISTRVLAQRVGMSERSLSDIEIDRRSCPPGLITSIIEVVEQFETDVQATIDLGRGRLNVSADPDGVWERAVIGRAAVESGSITPILVGNKRELVNGGWDRP